MIFCASYGYAGCSANVYLTFNGRLIACTGDLPYGILIDSSIYTQFSPYVSIYVDPNDSIIIGGEYGYSYYNDSVIMPDQNHNLFITQPGHYGFASICEDGAYEANVNLKVFFTDTIRKQIVNDQSYYLTIFPNPIISILKLNSSQKINQLNIYDELGRLQLSPQITLSSPTIYEGVVDQLARGIYTVEVIMDNDKRDYIKIVKQ